MKKSIIAALACVFLSTQAGANIANPGSYGPGPSAMVPDTVGNMRACYNDNPVSTAPEQYNGVMVNGKIVMSEAEWQQYTRTECRQHMLTRPPLRLTDFCAVMLYGEKKPTVKRAKQTLEQIHRVGRFAEYQWSASNFKDNAGRMLFGWTQSEGFKPILWTNNNVEC